MHQKPLHGLHLLLKFLKNLSKIIKNIKFIQIDFFTDPKTINFLELLEFHY